MDSLVKAEIAYTETMWEIWDRENSDEYNCECGECADCLTCEGQE